MTNNKALKFYKRNNLLIALTVGTLIASGSVVSAEKQAFSTESWYAVGGTSLFYPDADLNAAQDTPGIHLRLGRELTDNVDLQVGVSYNKAYEESPDAGSYKQTNFSVDALYLLTRESFRPFLMVGLGASRNQINYYQNAGLNTSFAGNVGAGFQYLFNDNFGIQVDARRIFSNADVSQSIYGANSGSIANNQLNMGLMYRFGGKPAVVAAVVVAPPVERVVERVVEVVKYVPAPPTVAPAPLVFEKQTFSAGALFALNSDIITETGKYELKNKISNQMLKHLEVTSVVIEGHTDRLGSNALNESLSTRRANNVKQYLVSQGVAKDRLRTIGKSSSEPLVTCTGARSQKVIDCLQPNRRVVIAIETQEQITKESK